MTASKRMEALRDAIVIVNEALRTAIKAQDHETFKILIDASDNLYGQYADATFQQFGIPCTEFLAAYGVPNQLG